MMGYFNIEDYEPVASRLDRFWKDHAEDGRIETELISHTNGHYIVRAKAFVGDRQVATGLADEHTEAKGVNARNALENAESSAIGRCLSNFNYQPKRDGKSIPELRPSREEMVKANVVDTLGGTPVPYVEKPITYLKPRRLATEKMSGWLQRELKKALPDTTQQNAFVQFASRRADAQIVPVSNLTFEEVKPLLNDIQTGHFVDNITAWKQGIPKSHETAELIAAGGAEDDPWTSPEF
jgi:hypothetical protein